MAVIEIDDLTKRYGTGGESVLAVDGLDLSVEAGEVFGFLGPNGAGKSTTIDVLLDYVRATSGNATVLGNDVHENSEALRHHLGVLPEGRGLYDRLTGRRHLEFAVDWLDADDDPDAVLERVGLSAADGARPVGDYSKGMAQRLALGMALVGDPDVLILDEPSAGLDPHGIARMRKIVREAASSGTTVFFSSHVLGEVEAVCDRVGILTDGELVAVDDVERLRKRVAAGSQLRLRIDDEVPIDVGRIDGVEAVDTSPGLLRVTVAEARAKARVVTALAEAGVAILDIDAEGASLEDVFRAYTNGGEPGHRSHATGDADRDGHRPESSGADDGREVIP